MMVTCESSKKASCDDRWGGNTFASDNREMEDIADMSYGGRNKMGADECVYLNQDMYT